MYASILVCDDEPHIRQIIAHKLRSAGFTVVEARNGEEALSLLSPEAKVPLKPSLIITDFQMPLITGLELCQVLKQRKDMATVPALMLTARGYTLTVEDLSRTNIRQVISKPFGLRPLLEKVVAILNQECPNLVPEGLRGPTPGSKAA